MNKALKKKLWDAFDKTTLEELTDSYKKEIEGLIIDEIDKIIDVYENEYIIPILIKLHNKCKSPTDRNTVFGVMDNLLPSKLAQFTSKISR